MHALFTRLAAFVERRPKSILFGSVVLVALAAIGVTGTEIVTSQEILVSPDSQAYQEYKEYGAAFGGDPLMIIFDGTQQELTSSDTIQALENLHQQFSSDPSIRSSVSPVTLLEAVELPEGTTITTPSVATSVIFGSTGEVTEEFASFFPDDSHEVMILRLADSLTVDEGKAVTQRVMDAVDEAGLPGEPIVAGNSRLISDITTSITQDMALTGAVAVLLMVIVLYIVFPVRRRLLALPMVLVGVLLTFGLTGAVGLSLTLVTMAGLPVLIGLGMDFAIQFHNRYEEESQAGRSPAQGMVKAMRQVGPAVSTAVLATILGFVTLLMSEVPAVRDFGILLAIGVAILFFVSLIGLNTLLYRLDHARNPGGSPTTGSDELDTTQHGHSGTERPARIPSALTWISTKAIRFGPAVVAIGVLLAMGGFAVDSELPVQTDIEQLVPSDTPGVEAMDEARSVLGSATSVAILVTADDVTSSETLTWMAQFQAEILASHSDQVVSASSLVTTLKLDDESTVAELSALSDEQRSSAMASALASIPEDVRIGLVSDDHTHASMDFNTTKLSISELDTLIENIKDEANAPDGVSLAAGGTVALGAAAVSSITDNRTTIAIVGFLAVLFGLLLVYRGIRRALTPVIPIVLVTGWSSGVMWLFDIELNPLTAVMSALIIGIGTEFTVLILERYWEELSSGADKHEAIRLAVSRVGRSITASALTVAAGFAALLASSFPALQEFATVTVIDVLLALVATLVVVPPLAMWLTPKSTKAERDEREQPARAAVPV